jgi:hypothetical protein
MIGFKIVINPICNCFKKTILALGGKTDNVHSFHFHKNNFILRKFLQKPCKKSNDLFIPQLAGLALP